MIDCTDKYSGVLGADDGRYAIVVAIVIVKVNVEIRVEVVSTGFWAEHTLPYSELSRHLAATADQERALDAVYPRSGLQMSSPPEGRSTPCLNYGVLRRENGNGQEPPQKGREFSQECAPAPPRPDEEAGSHDGRVYLQLEINTERRATPTLFIPLDGQRLAIFVMRMAHAAGASATAYDACRCIGTFGCSTLDVVSSSRSIAVDAFNNR
ncbi:hypothetical protein FHL15_005158 [Xylaria flabelliformis]|uniref:Uncharacterized protein n=1 Tax=Xylaria flabelliformis TaxID=2512241 RepID=A0A553I1K0_9PEZI|nr:hypothetical protein FHL15_005158 [Xylaria flabelliformis]